MIKRQMLQKLNSTLRYASSKVVSGIPERLAKISSLEYSFSPKTKEDLIQQSLINRNNTTHIEIAPHPLFNMDLKGKGIIRSLNSKDLKQISPNKEDVKTHKVLALGGLDFDNLPAIGAMLKYFHAITNKVLQEEDLVAIYPYVARDERYKSALEYNYDKTFISGYMETFVREWILPRFLNSNLELQEPETDLTLMSFSIGAREICMAENALRKILLDEYGCSKADVAVLFSYIKAVCVAYAIDYDNLPDLRFYKCALLSIGDDGVLNPEILAKEILGLNYPWSHGTALIRISEKTDYNFQTDLIFLGLGEVPLVSKTGQINTNGHFLPHYTEAITSSPDIMTYISNIIGDITHSNIE